MKITKLKKESKETDCEIGEEIEKLRVTVQTKLGINFKVTESPQMKPKMKIVNIDEKKIKLVLIDNKYLIDAIKMQNKIIANKECYIQIVKKIIKKKK